MIRTKKSEGSSNRRALVSEAECELFRSHCAYNIEEIPISCVGSTIGQGVARYLQLSCAMSPPSYLEHDIDRLPSKDYDGNAESNQNYYQLICRRLVGSSKR